MAQLHLDALRQSPPVAEIVDGNNLIGRLGGGTREGLVSELCEVARRKRKRLTVVFDGPPEAGRPKVQSFGEVTVVYAAPRTADEEIVRRIREQRDPRGVTVVTDDRALASTVSGAGARTAGIDVYRTDASRRLRAPAASEAEKPVPPGGPKDWERWFSDPRNRIA
jgi:predicted RNA-binding protein with PIN domain